MKKFLTLLLIALTATAALPSCAQRIDKEWSNRFTAPVLSPQTKQQKDPAYIYHKKPNDLKPVIERKAEKQEVLLYDNDRVMRMCREWKGCEKWARGRYALDTSFRITDMEVVYYFDQQHQRKWSYELYVQTLESGRARTYKLYKQEGQKKSPSWEEIDTFPGHPLDGPAQHAKYPSKKEIYARWEDVIVPRMNQGLIHRWKMAEERGVVWEDGKPVWKRRLYMYLVFRDAGSYQDYVCDGDYHLRTITRRYVIEAQQDSAGDSYTYSDGKWKECIFCN